MAKTKKKAPRETELKWAESWEKSGIYRYDPRVSRDKTYVIDTPPPTVSGSLHIGHVFSYTQTDILARFHRMKGMNIFYPMGWDDNGLPTERRVQNLLGITCDPSLPYDPSWKQELAAPDPKVKTPISRGNFLQECSKQTLEDEKKYEELWRRLGLSIDWSQQYTTINEHSRRISQKSFLDLIKKGHAYSIEAPTLWDTGFQTAVAQAEVEERSKQGFFHDLRMFTEDGQPFEISTTRPELLPACIAIVAHPEDERYQPLFGKTAITPLFRAPVPILSSEHADPEKGTGILMVCTFGDTHDIEFWRKAKLPIRQIIGQDGRFIPVGFGTTQFPSNNPEEANRYFKLLEGLPVPQARRKIVELLREPDGSSLPDKGAPLVSEPRETTQFVRFYEKGEYPLEYITTRQWFIRILDHKAVLIEQGQKIEWHPAYMRNRFEQWVSGLNQDWCISRQRYFGVPFPVWYKIDGAGATQYDQPIFATADRLPIDPLADVPPGYSEAQRGQTNGFTGDTSVMDTWATSSMTPQINSHWSVSEERHNALFPADLRPQAHEIIRTWAFYTIAKSWMHSQQIPWKEIAISGWVVDPNRDKMSKSKGNTITPDALIEKYSADAIRYWAGKAKLGQDTVFDEKMFQTGLRLTTKIQNASRFVMLQLEHTEVPVQIEAIAQPLDCAWVQKMKGLIASSTRNLESFDYAQALAEIESCFWDFCDNYLELAKTRAYQKRAEASGQSAIATLEWSLRTFLRLFAPYLPFTCEEIWSERFASQTGEPSIHRAPWPGISEVPDFEAITDKSYELASWTLNEIRASKSIASKNLKWPVKTLSIELPESDAPKLAAVMPDICDAGSVQDFSISSGSEFRAIVTLAGDE